MTGIRLVQAAGLAVLALMSVASIALADDNVKALNAAEVQTWELWKVKDQKGYAELLAEPAIRITAEGITAGVSKLVELDMGTTCGKRHYKLGPIRTHKVTSDVYVLTYRAEFGETCGGKPAVYKTYYSSTYRKDSDGWKNVVYTETTVID